MKQTRFNEVVHHLKTAFQLIDQYGIFDSRMLSKYAEFYVAWKMEELGYEVQIGSERTGKNSKNADIYLPNERIRVEVKSSIFKFPQGGWNASFGKGTQITKHKFDICVFIPFSIEEWWEVENTFVFTHEELREISNPRYIMAKFKNNACLLLYHGYYENYTKYMESWDDPEYQIEIDLHKNPEKYQENWDKMKEFL